MSFTDDTPAESGWPFRRWWTFISSGAVFALLVASVIFMFILNQPLLYVTLALILLLAIKDGLYLGGASVLDYAELVKSWRGGGNKAPVCNFKKEEEASE